MEVNKTTKEIQIHRGTYGVLNVIPELKDSKEPYVFKSDDVVQIKVFEAENYNNVVLQKRVNCEEGTSLVRIELLPSETAIGDLKSESVEYHYEIELNPDGNTQNIVGAEYKRKDIPKIFRLLPEGGEKE